MFGVGSLANYESYDQVGEGTYGFVYRARCKKTGDLVALKRLIFHKESAGFPLCAVREVKFLKSLVHKNIVTLREIVSSKGCEHLDVQIVKTTEEETKNEDSKESKETKVTKDQRKEKNNKEPETENIVVDLCGNLYLAFEYIEHDLGGLVSAKYKFSPRSIKCIIKQLFEALDFLNEKRVIHRDIKTSNILLSNYHQLKLADFGLARSSVSADGREGKIDLTNNVVTMWYKAPELLLGATRYTSAVDVWSAGCVLAELELGRPLFPGKSEIDQWDLIVKILGSPTEESYAGLNSVPNYDTFVKNTTKYSNTFRSVYASKINDQTMSLLERIFVLDPDRRPSPKIILTHSYFLSYPLPPTNPTELEPLQLAGASLHEFQTKQKLKQAQKEAAAGGKSPVTGEAVNTTANPTANPIAPDVSNNASSEVSTQSGTGYTAPYPPIVPGAPYCLPTSQSAGYSATAYLPPPMVPSAAAPGMAQPYYAATSQYMPAAHSLPPMYPQQQVGGAYPTYGYPPTTLAVGGVSESNAYYNNPQSFPYANVYPPPQIHHPYGPPSVPSGQYGMPPLTPTGGPMPPGTGQQGGFPQRSGSQQQQQQQANQICGHFLKGNCTWGSSCRFSHSGDMPNASSRMSQSDTKRHRGSS